MDPDAHIPPALKLLLSRRSLGARHLVEPGPDDAAIDLMVRAALRAPDHAELVPFVFKVVRGEAREALARLFSQAARDAGKSEADAAIDAERARRAPLTVALVARIDLGHPLVPAHEQWIAVGAALAKFLDAAHVLGYAGKMLSGSKVRHAALQAAFCAPGEVLVGWVALGTPRGVVPERGPKRDSRAVWSDWPVNAENRSDVTPATRRIPGSRGGGT